MIARAQVRAELEQWGLSDPEFDPLDTLHRLVSQSRRRADRLALELGEAVEAAGGSLADALTRKSMITTADGRVVEAAEHTSALFQAEGAERDRAARFSQLAIKCGLHERLVKLQEIQAQIAYQLVRYALDDKVLSLTAEQRHELPRALERGALAAETATQKVDLYGG